HLLPIACAVRRTSPEAAATHVPMSANLAALDEAIREMGKERRRQFEASRSGPSSVPASLGDAERAAAPMSIPPRAKYWPGETRLAKPNGGRRVATELRNRLDQCSFNRAGSVPHFVGRYSP